MKKTEEIVIIGAGVAGLAAAIRLQKTGYKVTVVEANSYPGGKLTAFNLGAYRFDTGPSLFTMPHYVDDLFLFCGNNPRDYFRYKRKNESCRYFWEDGTYMVAAANNEKFATVVESTLGVSRSVVLKKLHKSKEQFNLVGELFLEKPLHKPSTWLTKDVARALIRLGKFNLFSTMNKANEKELKHPKLVQLFNRYATYNGSSPYKAPALLNMIPHLEHGVGTFIPEGGMHSITASLFKLAQEQGVVFRFSERVEEIVIENSAVVGVKTSLGIVTAKKVVSNMDVSPTYRKLLKTIKPPEKTLNQERSSSALIFYWGIKNPFAQLGLHNILFSDNYKAEFESLFDEKVLFDDPTIYINITSKDIPSDAPEGCENWFVMINVPENIGQDWDNLIPIYRKRILEKISRVLKKNVEELIEVEDILDPRKIELRTSSLGGSLYGTSSNNRSAAFLRHTNESKFIKGLYFCGGSVHPGGGIPLCLMSGKIVSELISE
ncbi:MAG: 1-hydroxycarotenoid 3,4-desaturase CrtD [Flavobacteriales bacterium]